jgi:hypothetical protein
MIDVRPTASQRVLEILTLASQVPDGVTMAFHGDERVVRHLAALPGADVWGIVTIQGGTARVCWSVTAVIDHLRCTAAIARHATPTEIGAVESWQTTEMGARAGLLRRFPQVH